MKAKIIASNKRKYSKDRPPELCEEHGEELEWDDEWHEWFCFECVDVAVAGIFIDGGPG